MLQLTQSASLHRRQLTVDLVNIRRHLNASDTHITDVSTGIDDVTADITRLTTSGQAAQDNAIMMTSDAVDLSAAIQRLTELEEDGISVDNEVHAHSSSSSVSTVVMLSPNSGMQL